MIVGACWSYMAFSFNSTLPPRIKPNPLTLNPSSRWYNSLTTNDKPAQEDEEF